MNRKLNILLKLLGEEKLEEINSYVSEVSLNDFCVSLKKWYVTIF